CDQEIVFTSTRDGNREIYIMNVDGSDQTRLTTHPERDHQPSINPQGTRIAFCSARDGFDNIYVMNVDGTAPQNLTNNQYANNNPAWSPDGRKIIFSSSRSGIQRIYVMNSDGTQEKALTSSNDFSSVATPVYHPDGSRIAFSGYGTGTNRWDVWEMDADGSNLVNVSSGSSSDDTPAYDYNNDAIAFISYRTGETQVFRMDGDGGNQVDLTNDVTFEVYYPSYHPLDSRIVFSGYEQSANASQIYLMNADGSDVIALTSAGNNEDPSFSPKYKNLIVIGPAITP
ncbi:MAG: PD40 domain-containing protein, partial [Phycisphaerales bacterium]|nr:PD40 domain-containing protein [Phycisphaerales bacterium]